MLAPLIVGEQVTEQLSVPTGVGVDCIPVPGSVTDPKFSLEQDKKAKMIKDPNKAEIFDILRVILKYFSMFHNKAKKINTILDLSRSRSSDLAGILQSD